MSVPYIIFRDEAFPLKKYILKTYPKRQLDVSKRIFNYRLSRARENVFGNSVARLGLETLGCQHPDHWPRPFNGQSKATFNGSQRQFISW